MKAQTKKLIYDLILILLNGAMVFLGCVYFVAPNLLKIIVVLVFLLLAVTIPTINNRIIYRILVVCSIFLAVCLAGYIILEKTGWLFYLKDFETIKSFILSTREWGIIVYLFLVVFQVVVLPLPAAVTVLIGVAIYGSFWAFILSVIGTYIGSLIAFFLGRTFGKRLVSWMVGKENCEKYAKLLDEKGRGLFVIMLLFPFFPDDILCMVAGTTKMSNKFFITSMAITRPVMLAVFAFLGSGKIIPFSGWGIPVWIALFALTLLTFLLINRFKKKLTLSKPTINNKS